MFKYWLPRTGSLRVGWKGLREHHCRNCRLVFYTWVLIVCGHCTKFSGDAEMQELPFAAAKLFATAALLVRVKTGKPHTSIGGHNKTNFSIETQWAFLYHWKWIKLVQQKHTEQNQVVFMEPVIYSTVVPQYRWGNWFQDPHGHQNSWCSSSLYEIAYYLHISYAPPPIYFRSSLYYL